MPERAVSHVSITQRAVNHVSVTLTALTESEERNKLTGIMTVEWRNPGRCLTPSVPTENKQIIKCLILWFEPCARCEFGPVSDAPAEVGHLRQSGVDSVFLCRLKAAHTANYRIPLLRRLSSWIFITSWWRCPLTLLKDPIRQAN